LQRGRQPGVVAFDQLIDPAALRAADEMEPVQGPEGVGSDRVGADLGTRHRERRFQGGSAR
jgi:hypothetical protein